MKNIFAAHKRAISIMLRLSPRSSCKGFKRMGILTVPCLYIYICYHDVSLEIIIFIKQIMLFIIYVQDSLKSYMFPKQNYLDSKRCVVFIAHNL
jgi:hypothetical protein